MKKITLLFRFIPALKRGDKTVSVLKQRRLIGLGQDAQAAVLGQNFDHVFVRPRAAG